MDEVQSATVRERVLLLWDLVIDLQDEVAALLSEMEKPAKIPREAEAWVYRAGEKPVKVNLVEYARGVLGGVE